MDVGSQNDIVSSLRRDDTFGHTVTKWVGVFILITGFIGGGLSGLLLLFAADTKNWPMTPGYMIQHPTEGKTGYWYQVKDKTFVSNTWVFKPGSRNVVRNVQVNAKGQVLDPIAKQPLDQKLSWLISYHPDDASRSVYYPGMRWIHIACAIVFILISGFGIVLYRLGRLHERLGKTLLAEHACGIR